MVNIDSVKGTIFEVLMEVFNDEYKASKELILIVDAYKGRHKEDA
jgi:hypothetical protein